MLNTTSLTVTYTHEIAPSIKIHTISSFPKDSSCLFASILPSTPHHTVTDRLFFFHCRLVCILPKWNHTLCTLLYVVSVTQRNGPGIHQCDQLIPYYCQVIAFSLLKYIVFYLPFHTLMDFQALSSFGQI